MMFDKDNTNFNGEYRKNVGVCKDYEDDKV